MEGWRAGDTRLLHHLLRPPRSKCQQRCWLNLSLSSGWSDRMEFSNDLITACSLLPFFFFAIPRLLRSFCIAIRCIVIVSGEKNGGKFIQSSRRKLEFRGGERKVKSSISGWHIGSANDRVYRNFIVKRTGSPRRNLPFEEHVLVHVDPSTVLPTRLAKIHRDKWIECFQAGTNYRLIDWKNISPTPST